MNIYMASNVNR